MARPATGVRQRHLKGCKGNGRCKCPWRAEVYSEADKKKIRETFPNVTEANTWRADHLTAAKNGSLRTPTATTIAQAAQVLLTGARDGSIPAAGGGRFKPATIRGYEVSLRKRLLPAFGHVRLSELRRGDVQDFADMLTAEGLSASTVQNTLDPLRVIYRRARRRDEIAVDPTEDLELRRPDGKRERIASATEATALLDAMQESERALWATAFYAGLRRGELRALRWDDVDLTARTIHVKRGWDAIEGEQDGKSDAANRLVPILDPLAPLLAAHKLATGRDSDALVFGRTDQGPFSPETVRRRSMVAWGWREIRNPKPDARPKMVYVKAREDALEPITFHECRHTCASLLIASNANAKTLSAIMGHASVAMTYDIYGHLMPDGLEHAAAQANAYLAQQAGERPTLRVVG
jgi:integrase